MTNISNMRQRLLILFTLSIAMTSCHVGRFFLYNFSDIRDYRKFPAAEVARGSEVFTFADGRKADHGLTLPGTWPVKDKARPFAEALDKSKTVAFLVIRNDSILYDWYGNGYNRESIVTSFSVVKSVVSALMGIAIDEGYVGSVSDPITNYLPYLDESEFAPITIAHLLDMESGIAFQESYYSPFSDAAKFYYGRRLDKYLTKLEVERPPGEGFRYKSINTLLLAQIIEATTKMPLSEYLSTRLWQPMDTEFSASLSLDREGGTAKAFAGLNGRAIDFAKFGRLYLNRGRWEDEQIVPAYWVDRSTDNLDGDSFRKYRYQWWHPRYYQTYQETETYSEPYRLISGEDGTRYVLKPVDYYSATGHLGQYIAVLPQDRMIVVRFGKKKGHLDWYRLFQWIAEHNG